MKLDNVLPDTGAGTIFNANVVEKIGVVPETHGIVDTLRGVGGVEDVLGFDFISAARLVIDQ